MTKYKVAVIGCGHRGEEHIRAYEFIDNDADEDASRRRDDDE